MNSPLSEHKKAFYSACGFMITGHRLQSLTPTLHLNQGSNDVDNYCELIGNVSTAVITTYLAIEIGLKALLGKEKGSLPHGHDLLILFSKLSFKTQKKLSDNYNLLIEDNKNSPHIVVKSLLNVNELITEINGTFTPWRYLYEKHSGLNFPFGEANMWLYVK
jgi:HEPN domain